METLRQLAAQVSLLIAQPQEESKLIAIHEMSQLSSHVQEPPRPPPPTELKEIGQKISSSLSTLTTLFTALRKPLPEGTEGGKVIHPKEEPWLIKQIEHDLADLRALGITDLKALIDLQQQVASGQPIDDKKYLVEGLIKVNRVVYHTAKRKYGSNLF